VIRTITQEEKYSTRIAKRDGGGEIQITELFELAEGFDSMLAVIESRENKITHINENLEKIVEQRTQQLQNAQANMMQSAKLSALGEMAAGVAHEINNPLAIICGTVSLSLERLESENPNLEKIREGLIKIENTSNKIAKIIRGLKMFSRNSEKDPMFPTPLASVINDTLELCQERFKEAGLALQVSPIPEMSIFCRPSQISQVILNLLNNAFDAIEGLSERWISLKVNALDSKIQIAVEDSGPGISPEILSKIMHPFFTTKAIGKGTGLGLSMSKGMIEDHAGTLEYDGSSGHTCFKIILPLRPNSALSATQDGVESPSKKIKLSF
jgi:C4-dicarboxylate-specific signal transduction histidine kinase